MPATKTFTNQIETFLYLVYRLGCLDTPRENQQVYSTCGSGRMLDRIPELMEQTIEMV